MTGFVAFGGAFEDNEAIAGGIVAAIDLRQSRNIPQKSNIRYFIAVLNKQSISTGHIQPSINSGHSTNNKFHDDGADEDFDPVLDHTTRGDQITERDLFSDADSLVDEIMESPPRKFLRRVDRRKSMA
jgi:hypothetical protein